MFYRGSNVHDLSINDHSQASGLCLASLLLRSTKPDAACFLVAAHRRNEQRRYKMQPFNFTVYKSADGVSC